MTQTLPNSLTTIDKIKTKDSPIVQAIINGVNNLINSLIIQNNLIEGEYDITNIVGNLTEEQKKRVINSSLFFIDSLGYQVKLDKENQNILKLKLNYSTELNQISF